MKALFLPENAIYIVDSYLSFDIETKYSLYVLIEETVAAINPKWEITLGKKFFNRYSMICISSIQRILDGIISLGIYGHTSSLNCTPFHNYCPIFWIFFISRKHHNTITMIYDRRMISFYATLQALHSLILSPLGKDQSIEDRLKWGFQTLSLKVIVITN